LYFAWLGFYTLALIVPSALGVLVFIGGIGAMSTQTVSWPIFVSLPMGLSPSSWLARTFESSATATLPCVQSAMMAASGGS
jgi:hypothetical protein